MTPTPTRSGSYPIARGAGEIERLRIQAAALGFDAGGMLDRIGVGRELAVSRPRLRSRGTPSGLGPP